MARDTKKSKIVVIYDADCAVCRGGVRWLKRRSVGGFRYTPCQSLEISRYPQIDQKDCMQAIYIVLPNGDVYHGAEAIPHLLHRLKGWRLVAGMLKKWPLKIISPVIYKWIAEHRYAISCMLKK